MTWITAVPRHLVVFGVFGVFATSCTNPASDEVPNEEDIELVDANSVSVVPDPEWAMLDSKLSPEQITLAFIQDFKSWNDYAYSLRVSGVERAMSKAEESYDDLIDKYCPESYTRQPIAFGSESDHDPVNETIQGFDLDGNRATVHTKHERRLGGLDLSNFYDYSFERVGGRWYLVSVAVVIDGEKHEGL